MREKLKIKTFNGDIKEKVTRMVRGRAQNGIRKNFKAHIRSKSQREKQSKKT